MCQWIVVWRFTSYDDSPGWSQLPLFVLLCAVCKIAAVPCVLLLLSLRRRVARHAAEC